MVTFSGLALSASNGEMRVQVLLDGSKICEPGNNQLTAAGSFFEDRSMTFICEGVAPGSHSMVMQFKSNFGELVTLLDRTTVVHYLH